MTRVCIICLGTIVLFSLVLSFGEDDIDPDKDDPYSRGTATRIKSVEKLFFSGTPQYMAILMTVASDMRTESVACYNHLKMVADSVKSKKLAGFQIMDSTSGPSPVLSNQNSISKRSIRQCTDSVITGDVHANYCPAKIEIRTALTDKTTPLEHELKKRSPYNFGICLPPTCDSQLVQKTFQKYLKDTDLQVTISSKCVAHVAKITRSDVTAVATACLVAILAVVIASTYLDDIGHAKWQDGSGWRKALLNFSLKRNLIRLNSDFEDGANRNLYFVHGIRSFFILSSLWLNLWVFTSTFDPGHVDTGDMNHWTYTLIKNVSLSMYDAMFIISGLLVMYTWLPQFERGVAKFGRFLMTRWLRTIPTMSGVMLIAFALSPVTERDCQNWWSPLFFVNNWIHPHETCLPAMWYISVDSQIYVFSFLLLLLISTRPRFGLWATSAIGCSSQALSLWVSERHTTEDIVQGYGFVNSFASYNYLFSFSLGILIGYHIVKNRKLSDKASRITNSLVFLVAIISLSLEVYGKELMNRNYQDLYCRLSRNVLLAWTMYKLAHGRYRVAQNILSRRFHVPLSRMAFSIYASQPIAVMIDSALSDMPLASWYLVSTRFLTVTFLSLWLGAIVHLCLEAPSVALLRDYLTAKKREPVTDHKVKRLRVNNNSKMAEILKISEAPTVSFSFKKTI